MACSKTTLTGESRFHTSPHRGFEPVSLAAGSKQVVHWTSETHVRLQALHRAPPPATDSVVVKPEGRPAVSVKPGQESCVIKSISAYTLSALGLVKHLEGDKASDRITSGSPM
jgi:hypothetical protein